MDLLVNCVDTLINKIQIFRAEQSTRLCFNLYFVSIFPFIQQPSLIGHFSFSALVPFFLFAAITITTVEAVWGDPRDMKNNQQGWSLPETVSYL